jgi:F-type H+-transporting ATPase subunit epsilon
MRLTLIIPARVLLDLDQVASVRAEDASGQFGIWPHHADLITVLTVSVLSWRRLDGGADFAAVRGGVLTVAGGEVRVATPEAVLADSLDALAAGTLARLRSDQQAEERAHRVMARCERQLLAELARAGAPERP